MLHSTVYNSKYFSFVGMFRDKLHLKISFSCNQLCH